MLNPLQTTLTHAEPAADETGGFPAALERTLWSLYAAATSAGLEPRGRARAKILRSDDEPPVIVGTLIAGGPDLPDPVSVYREPAHPVEGEPLAHFTLNADGTVEQNVPRWGIEGPPLLEPPADLDTARRERARLAARRLADHYGVPLVEHRQAHVEHTMRPAVTGDEPTC